MDPETVPSLVIITAAKATYIVIAAVIGMLVSLYCGYRIGRLAKAKPAKAKTFIKTHALTEEQTLTVAAFQDALADSAKDAYVNRVKMWQYIGSCLDKDDRCDAMELNMKNNKRWRLEITKDVVPELPPGNPELGQIAAHTAKQMMAEKTP